MQKAKKTKEIKLPLKFNPGMQGYEPDIEKIEEIKKHLEKKKKVYPSMANLKKKPKWIKKR